MPRDVDNHDDLLAYYNAMDDAAEDAANEEGEE